MPMFNAHNWFIDREDDLTAQESALTNFSLGAPATGRVHACGGMSQVQIAHFGVLTAADINVYHFYSVDPVGGASQAGIQLNVTYLTVPIASISFVAGTGAGVVEAKIVVADKFSDGVTVTLIAGAAYEVFGGVAAPGDVEYNSTADDVGIAVLRLPACWGFVTAWTTKVAGTTSSNLLLKFS